MGLGYYLDRTGHLSTLTVKIRAARENDKFKLPKDWHPTLAEMLKYVVDKDTDIIRNGNLLKALRKLISQDKELLSIDTLNLFVHNQHFYPNEDDLREFWSQLQGLLEIILVEPNGDDDDE
jgi:hypothetical protein